MPISTHALQLAKLSVADTDTLLDFERRRRQHHRHRIGGRQEHEHIQTPKRLRARSLVCPQPGGSNR